MSGPVYKRILLKLSGESLGDYESESVDYAKALDVGKKILKLKSTGASIAIVIGGGNLFRGSKGTAKGIERVTADRIGMTATLMNAMVLSDALEKTGLDPVIMSPIPLSNFIEPYNSKSAIEHLDNGRTVICAGGMGVPFFTTDTNGVLRAVELGCDVMAKATNVDCMYDRDPKKHDDAKKIENISYDEVIAKNLSVLDLTAVSLAKENKLPILIFNFNNEELFEKIPTGQGAGTVISV